MKAKTRKPYPSKLRAYGYVVERFIFKKWCKDGKIHYTKKEAMYWCAGVLKSRIKGLYDE